PPASVAGIPVRSIGTKDGIKLYLDGGAWILLRPSGTEPLVRLYVEAPDLDSQQAIVKAMKAHIAAVSP
ncbi:MAG: phosphoglucomutase/phosphomannomutase family protein, partial [Cyanobacteria bacterium P01_D01_bin.123]